MAHHLAGRRSRDILAEQVGESQDQIRRYIRLTYLLPPLLKMVDKGSLPLRPAVELSYLSSDEQKTLSDIMSAQSATPSLEQAQRLKEHSEKGELSTETITAIMLESKPRSVQITLERKCLSQYFPKEYTQQQMEEVIFSLLETWKSQQKGAVQNDSDG